MINGMTVSRWACINFSRSVQESVARGFCNELAQMCQVSGMVIFLPSCNYVHWAISKRSFFPFLHFMILLICSCYVGIQSRACYSNLQCQARSSRESLEACISFFYEQNQRKRTRAFISYSARQQRIPLWYAICFRKLVVIVIYAYLSF